MAGIDEHGFAGHAARPVADQTRSHRTDFLDAHQRVLGRALRGLIQQLVEGRDARGGTRANRSRRP